MVLTEKNVCTFQFVIVTSPIKTKMVRVSENELFPRCSKRSYKMSLIDLMCEHI